MAIVTERVRIGLIGSDQRGGEGGRPQEVAGGDGEDGEKGLAGEGRGHWLFSDMLNIDNQYGESRLLSIDNIEKRYLAHRYAVRTCSGASLPDPMGEDMRSPMTGSAAGSGTDKLLGIQYLRALAALMVLAAHANHGRVPALQFLGTGVDLFFLISGFVMTVTTAQGSDPREFMMKRLIRIVPLYWVATTIAVLVARFLPPFQYGQDRWHVMASFLFIPAISPWDGLMRPPLGPGWTLNYEMEFYLLFTLGLFAPARLRLPLVCGALISMTAAGLVLQPQSVVMQYWLHPIVLEFAAGMAIAVLWLRGAPLLWPGLLFVAVVAAAFPFLPPWFTAVTVPLDNPLARPFVILAFVPLVCAVLALERKQKGLPRVKFALLLGDASYAIYLFQYFVLLGVSLAVMEWGISGLTQTVLILSVGTLLGIVVHVFIERPLLFHLRRLFLTRRRFTQPESAAAG